MRAPLAAPKSRQPSRLPVGETNRSSPLVRQLRPLVGKAHRPNTPRRRPRPLEGEANRLNRSRGSSSFPRRQQKIETTEARVHIRRWRGVLRLQPRETHHFDDQTYKKHSETGVSDHWSFEQIADYVAKHPPSPRLLDMRASCGDEEASWKDDCCQILTTCAHYGKPLTQATSSSGQARRCCS